jgi:general bacterial porin, GBP family
VIDESRRDLKLRHHLINSLEGNMKFTFLIAGRTALATAALLACNVGQAQSSVTLYGIVAVDLVAVSNSSSGGSKRMEPGRLNAPRIGFKGSEDLGGGLSAIFGVEAGLNPDTGAAGTPFWNRGSYVGLKSSAGSLTLGRQWNVNDDILGNFFVFGGYAVFSYGGFGYTSDTFNNSVKFVSRSIGGLTIEALIAASDNGVEPRAVELGGMYEGGSFKAALTYSQQEYPTGLKDRMTAGGVSYNIVPFNLRFGAASVDNQTTALKARSFDVGVDLTFGAAGMSLDYVTRDVSNSSNDSDFLRLLGKYKLSKRTELNANVVMLKNKALAAEGFYGISAPGASQDVISVGMSHAF